MAKLKLVEYQTFIDHHETGLVSNVSIYNFSPEVELTYTFDEVAYGTSGSFGLVQDTLLHRALEEKSIEFTLLSTKYEGPEVSGDGLLGFSSALIFAVPLVLVAVVFVQAMIIKRLVNKVEETGYGEK